MFRTGSEWVVSASDLVDVLECEHRSKLSYAVAAGLPGAPAAADGPDELVAKHGIGHERRVLESFQARYGDGVVVIDEPSSVTADALTAAAEATQKAMADGAPVVYQAVLFDGQFYGRADFLLSAEADVATKKAADAKAAALAEFDGEAGGAAPCEPGSYVPYDTKLARHVRPAAVLQLTSYADALTRTGRPLPARMCLLLGNDKREELRPAEFTPLLRRVRGELDSRLARPAAIPTPPYGEAKPACETCRFAQHCAGGREQAGDLSLVAGIRAEARRKLTRDGIESIQTLADAPDDTRPASLAEHTWATLRAQAKLQVAQDRTGGRVHTDVFAPENLASLPDPTPYDVFFDMEGDPYYGAGAGLEYLFGAVILDGRPTTPAPVADPCDETGMPVETFRGFWAHDRAQEKAAFEDFVDFVVERMDADRCARIYHYAPYEPTALKKLAARHATREDAVDDLLRQHRLVDLYTVVRKSLRVSQRSYSIKYLEPLYMPAARAGAVVNAGASIEYYEVYTAHVEAGELPQAAEALEKIREYNEYDCVSTHRLYRMLLGLRVDAGIVPVAPEPAQVTDGEPADDEARAARRAEQKAREERLTEPLRRNLGADPDTYSPPERARNLLAHSVGYYRREMNPAWWDFFRFIALPLAELAVESTCAVPVRAQAGEWLPPTGRAKKAKRTLTMTCDPEHPHPFGAGENVRLLYPGEPGHDGVTSNARVEDVDGDTLVLTESCTLGEETAEVPLAVLPGPPVRPDPKPAAVEYLAEQTAKHLDNLGNLARHAGDVIADLPAHPGIDLLLRRPPRTLSGRGLEGLPDDPAGADPIPAVIAAVDDLDRSYLPVQGPPGAGKTYLAGQLIRHLVARGASVGVCSTSHAAVENVLESATGKRDGTDPDWSAAVPAAKIPRSGSTSSAGEASRKPPWEQPRDVKGLARFRGKHTGGHLVGGTSWTFANAAMRAEPVDYLLVDEAGQFALADALAVSTAARNLVLLGDPQQLPQVVQGSHPLGADASALGHVLGEEEVVPPTLGYFLAQSRRMHPAVCAPVSELSYQGKLHSHPSAARRHVDGVAPGLYRLDVEHTGNTTSAQQEADAIVDAVGWLTGRTWTDAARDDRVEKRPLTERDIIVVAPFNRQVRIVRRSLADAGFGGVRVGTVDRFQGQEAPVVLATMTASSGEDLPRGLDFLLSRNRLNVALSRAQAVSVLVCAPTLATAAVRSVEQMRLVSGFAGLLERSRPWAWQARPGERA